MRIARITSSTTITPRSFGNNNQYSAKIVDFTCDNYDPRTNQFSGTTRETIQMPDDFKLPEVGYYQIIFHADQKAYGRLAAGDTPELVKLEKYQPPKPLE